LDEAFIMRRALGLIVAIGGLVALGQSTQAGVPPFKGNDTGGIIAWSPEAQRFRHEMAGDFCALWGKTHRITSVTPRYGDYIAFACYWPRGSDGVIVRRSY
jgi:hypothetical protein